MKKLLFGASGQVGTELRRLWKDEDTVFLSRTDCDLCNSIAIREVIRRCEPKLIVNAAAYTAVDHAETDVENCFAINGVAPGIMAEEAEELGALLVHYSTDYVFDGSKPEPYAEGDEVNPQNQYGKSKHAGELAIQRTRAKYLVLRTSWVYSPYGHNFVKTMLRLGTERDQLRIVDDQVGAPTSAAAIARATVRILSGYSSKSEFPGGLYHMTAEGHISWAGFAHEIFRQAKLEPVPAIQPISTEEYPMPARRPKNSRLSNESFAQTFGFRLSGWREQLQETIAVLMPEAAGAQSVPEE